MMDRFFQSLESWLVRYYIDKALIAVHSAKKYSNLKVCQHLENATTQLALAKHFHVTMGKGRRAST